jgi:hypothetical protein
MRKFLLLFLLFAFFFANAQQSCTTAQNVVIDQVYNYGIINGQQATPACTGVLASAAMWYIFVPVTSMEVTLSTDLPQNAGKDPRVFVYTGTCDELTCYASDDDSGTGYLAEVSFEVQAGTLYYIAFDNRWAAASNNVDFIITETDEGTPPTPAAFNFTSQSRTIVGQFKNGLVDMNGDFLDDIVSISNNQIEIHFQQPNGTFNTQVFPTPVVASGYLPSWSLTAADYNADGFTDLLYGGGNGVTFMKSLAGGSGFERVAFSQYVFSQRGNFIDINNDGHLDAFMCHDVAPNVFYMNDGNGNLTFNQGGLGNFPTGGNYGSIWVDYDNDGDADLFLAKCRGGAVNGANMNEMHRNNGDGTFTEVGEEIGLRDGIQTWSSAWADFDNDGFMDVFVGVSSNSNGMHKLMRNNGNGTFTDITATTGIASFFQTGIEFVAHDFDNDGFVDIFCGDNGVILKNNGNMTFTAHSVLPTSGSIGDVNNDGFLDVYNGNNLRINQPNGNHWIKIHLQGVQSNRNGIGARVEIYGAWGKQIRDVRSGDGFRYMSSLNTHFGIGSHSEISQVIVRWPSGTVDIISNPAVDQALFVLEGGTLSNDLVDKKSLVVYPNPADQILLVSNVNPDELFFEIFDLQGKKQMSGLLKDNQIQVHALSTGSYFIRISNAEGNARVSKFIKK